MKKIGFIGLGNMGAPMAKNLVQKGFDVTGFDMDPARTDWLVENGAKGATSVAGAAQGMDVIISMLPEGAHVRRVMEDPHGAFASAPADALVIDCSTIDVASARRLSRKGRDMGLL